MRRGAFCVVARMTWTKLLSREAAAAMTPALKEAVELALREIVTKETNGEVRHCVADVVETMMRKEGFRAFTTVKDVVEAVATKPMIKRLALEGPGGAGAYFRNVANFLHVLDSAAEGSMLKEFIEAIDKVLIRDGPDGKVFEYIDDHLRSFLGSTSLFVNRPPLSKAAFEANEQLGRTMLKQFYSEAGCDPFKLTGHAQASRTRGVIIETDIYHKEFRAFARTPNAQPTDWLLEPVAMELKSVSTAGVPERAIEGMTALARFGTENRQYTTLKLLVKTDPAKGQAYVDLIDDALRTLRNDLVRDGEVPEGTTLSYEVLMYHFLPNE
jgi:hypothetical protein